MSKIILGLVGPMASGKGTVKEYIVKKYKAEDCRFSTILRDLLKRLSLEINRKNMQDISTVLRGHFGEDLLAKVIANDVKAMKSDVVIVDGVRRMADIAYLKELPGFKLVAIDADPKIRYERMKSRNENPGDDQKTLEQFLADHKREADEEIPAVMKRADLTIDNSGSVEELKKQIDNILKKQNHENIHIR